MSSTSKNSGPRSLRFAAVTLSAALAFGAPTVQAWWPVQETGFSLVQHLLNQINTYHQKIQDAVEYGEEKTRWIRTLEQYRQALIKVQAQLNAIGLPGSAPLEKVEPDYMVLETCGEKKSFDPMAMLTKFVLKTDEDLKSQQVQICVNIRTMQNRKFNDTIDFMTDTVPQMQNSLNRIFSIRVGSNDEGNVRGADSESLRTANDIALMTQAWEGRMKSYDSYIAVMEQNQKLLAQTALKGNPAKQMASELVKTVALKAALSVD